MRESSVAGIALGGNQGDVASAFVAAVVALRAADRVILGARSSVYRTPAWGRTDQPDFLNAALLVTTTLCAPDLLALCLSIEQAQGRDRGAHALRWGPRTLDLDLIFFDDLVCDTPRLTLPHPQAVNRAFVLMPLAEVAPEYRMGDASLAHLRDAISGDGIRKDLDATALFQNA